MQHYVAGFMFDESLEHVALIKKNRPQWQAGLLNAIGGHVEQDESYDYAMCREFFEETGLSTFRSDWKVAARLDGDGFSVVFYAIIGPIRELKTTTDEPIDVFHVDCIDETNAIPNLTWLVPLARLVLQGKSKTVIVREV